MIKQNVKFIPFAFIILFMSIVVFAQEVLTEDQAKRMAEDTFQKEVPPSIRNEFVLVFSGRVEYVQGDNSLYKVFWERRVNNITVPYDGFFFTIYLRTGEIISKELKYSTQSSQIDTTYTISKDQAKWILLQKKLEIQKEPQLQIRNNKVVWDVYAEGCEMGIDAKTGSIEIYGCSTGVAPDISNVRFDPTAYYIDVYGIYFALGMLAISGLVYWKRQSIFGRGKK